MFTNSSSKCLKIINDLVSHGLDFEIFDYQNS